MIILLNGKIEMLLHPIEINKMLVPFSGNVEMLVCVNAEDDLFRSMKGLK